MAKAKKLPSGSWRALVYSGRGADGKRQYESITATTEAECNMKAAAFAVHRSKINRDKLNMTLGEAMSDYIAKRDGILSPTTVQGYRKIAKNHFIELQAVTLKKIDVDMLQDALNAEAKRECKNRSKKLSHKTIINAFGFTLSVIKKYNRGFTAELDDFSIPAKESVVKELVPPEIILDVVKGTAVELPALLAMWLSFSLSEIRGLTKSKSISGGYISIREVVVDVNNKPIRKDQAKVFTRIRKHKIPEYIQTLIDQTDPEEDQLVTLSGQAIYKRFSRLLEKNGLPHMTFHDLRHVNASVMLELGVPDKYAMERGGWKTTHTMKSVYQHTFSAKRQEVDKIIDEYFQQKMQHDMQHEDEKQA